MSDLLVLNIVLLFIVVNELVCVHFSSPRERHVEPLLRDKQIVIYNEDLDNSARSRRGNHRYNYLFRAEVLRIVREQYSDFSPTFALEKLSEYHNLSISMDDR